MKRATLLAFALSFALGVSVSDAQAQSRIFNTVKEKLAAGERVVGGTVSTPDPDIYCAMANSGFDFMWIEMQHSPLTYTDVARMIWACRGAPAIPFIRVPNATEGDIQKATDIGALGIIVPMVDDADKIRNAVTFAKFPPMGKRSQGGGQYRALWGNDYRRTANDNIMIIAMIESPAGVANAAEIAGVPGVDVVFAASSDLGSFSGKRQGDPEYEALVTAIEAGTLGADRLLGGPLAWMSTRAPYRFFQGPGTTSLIRRGASVVLEAATPCRELPAGVAPIEGEERCR
ncbi:MAG: aldolase/citrate lyase family protein [Gemmatimonadota bacterium]|jgi:4-hydroxy-2-oxoheptanedioate aldolase|nr:aldolase/citrate lyase family protein [Gemmatimonadota bacterium]